jgi:hypothetical protein
LTANASTSTYCPTLYFRAEQSENISVSGDAVYINSDELKNGDMTVKVGVYIQDDVQLTYRVRAKWKCDSEYITLTNITNPTVDTGVTSEYTTSSGDTFSTSLTPTCFSKINSDGTLKIVPTPQIAELSEQNLLSYSVYRDIDTTPLDYLGSSSDEFPLTSFDTVIDSDTPDGTYEIYFPTRSSLTEDTSSVSTIYVYSDNTSINRETVDPETYSLKLIIGDGIVPGDVNSDGKTDGVDSSAVLIHYTLTATNQGGLFTDEKQLKAADVNNDGKADGVDSTAILRYYTYTATGGRNTIEEFLAG